MFRGNSDFALKDLASFEFLIYQPWHRRGLVHGFSTRSLNFSGENINLITQKLEQNLGLSKLYYLEQVHGKVICSLDELSDHEKPAVGDGILVKLGALSTGQRIAVAVKTADCLPVMFVSDTACAVVHAGWRGLAAGILEQAAKHFVGQSCEVVIGPHAKKCCYQVGPEVFNAFGQEMPKASNANSANIDLTQIAKAKLQNVLGGNVSVYDSEVCTICNNNFNSHRRDGQRAGRAINLFIISRSAPGSYSECHKSVAK